MKYLRIDDQGPVRILEMNRPEKHNALNTGLTQELLEGLSAADSDPGVRVVILTGAGKSFCAGADTSEFTSLVPDDPVAVAARANLTSRLHLIFSQMRKPVISAVRGNALGGGAGLAIACDLSVMSETVRFGFPELRHGIVAAVVMANLVRQLGRKQAFELVSLTEPLDGNAAKAWGLCNRVVPDGQVMATATQLAQNIAQWNPIAMAATKRLFYRVADLDLAKALEVGRDTNIVMRGFRSA